MLLIRNPRIFIFFPHPRPIILNLYAMSPPSSIKIVAEYAKSSKSSCKKCSEKIDSKSLRLGLITRDPRGYDSTKWHHIPCFFSLSPNPVSSAESIEGFSELMVSDQEKLKQIVSEGGQSSTELDKDEETEHEERKENNEKLDKDEETEHEERKENNEKIVAEYAKSARSSCKKCSEKIESKSLRLGLSSWDRRGFENTKWYHVNCFPLNASSLSSVEMIEGFSDLKSSDQDKLKKFVSEGDQSSKLDEDDTTELQEQDEKLDKDKETELEEKNKNIEKITAEYAKSGRSSCKKCSEKIESKSLRLGSSIWDPRGFENTKWYHLNCFPLNSSVSSVKSIEGFSDLKSSDQDKLKKLVSEGDQSSKKLDEDDTCELQEQDKKNRKRKGEVETELDRRNLKTIKTSDEGCRLRIAFACSDIKDNYKGAKLGSKWKAFQTIIFLGQEDGLKDSSKIAAFDFDGCLAKTSVQRVGADAWSLMYASIPKKLQSLYNDGYKLVIFTNEANIERWKNKRQVAVDSKIGRLDSFIKLVNVPIQVFIACGISKVKGQEEDPFRKPQPGMWRIMEQHFNSGIPVDMEQSFYVGDAAGRKDDHSDADKKFAETVGLKFYLPEDYFDASS